MAELREEILVTIPVNERHKAYLEGRAPGFLFRYASGKELTEEMVQGADIIIGNVPPGMIHASARLKWIQLNSAGADAFVKPGILDGRTMLTNATGAYGLTVSEHMLALVFTLIRRLNEYQSNQEKREWRAMGSVMSVEGSRTLVLGLGDIGGDFARKMKALGSYVIGVRRTNRDQPDYLDEQHLLEDLDELLPRADIVAMVLPGGDATNHLMDAKRLHLMKKGAYLINVGRGNAIDPKALFEALEEGHLGGCGLDVTEPEPLPADDPLWGAKNLVITPHVAGNFWLAETLERIVRIAGENLDAWVCGAKMKNQVDFSTGYRK